MSLIFSFFSLHYSWILSMRLFNSAAVQSLLQYPSNVRYLIRISLCHHKPLSPLSLASWGQAVIPTTGCTWTLPCCVTHVLDVPEQLSNTNSGEKYRGEIWGAVSTPEISFSENLKLLSFYSLLSYWADCLILNFSNVFYQYEILFTFVILALSSLYHADSFRHFAPDVAYFNSLLVTAKKWWFQDCP